MSWTFYPWYHFPILLGAVLALWLAQVAWRRRPAPGTRPATWMMLATAWWAIGASVELASPTLAMKLLCTDIMYPAIAFAPPLWLLVILESCGLSPLLTRRALCLGSLPPVLMILLVWTNPWHHLLYSRTWLVHEASIPLLGLTHAPLFWYFFAYLYLLCLIGFLLAVQALVRASTLYRGQLYVLIAAALIPLLANIAYLTRSGPFKFLELTPLAFTLSGSLLMWGMHRYRLWELTPPAPQFIFDSLDDGILVLDAQGQILQANMAVGPILRQEASTVVGRQLAHCLPSWPRIALQLQVEPTETGCLHPLVRADGEESIYRITSQPWHHGMHYRGHLCIFRDVTAEIRMVEEQERGKLARFVHDELGQSLSASLLHLQVAQEQLPEVPQARLRQIAQLLETTLQHTRALTHQLTLPALLGDALGPALSRLAAELRVHFTRPIALHLATPEPTLTDAQRRLLFRVAREGLINVIKHARASRVVLTTTVTSDQLCLTLTDDGVGIHAAPRDASQPTGFGLVSLTEDVHRARGTIQLTSPPAGGTMLRVCVPLGTDALAIGDTSLCLPPSFSPMITPSCARACAPSSQAADMPSVAKPQTA
jgi:PAS domain S-box-containing protein